MSQFTIYLNGYCQAVYCIINVRGMYVEKCVGLRIYLHAKSLFYQYVASADRANEFKCWSQLAPTESGWDDFADVFPRASFAHLFPLPLIITKLSKRVIHHPNPCTHTHLRVARLVLHRRSKMTTPLKDPEVALPPLYASCDNFPQYLTRRRQTMGLWLYPKEWPVA